MQLERSLNVLEALCLPFLIRSQAKRLSERQLSQLRQDFFLQLTVAKLGAQSVQPVGIGLNDAMIRLGSLNEETLAKLAAYFRLKHDSFEVR